LYRLIPEGRRRSLSRVLPAAFPQDSLNYLARVCYLISRNQRSIVQ